MNLFRLGFCVLVVLVLVQAADKKSVRKVPAKEAAVQQPKKPAVEAAKPKVVEVAAAAKPKAVAVAAPVKEKAKEAVVPVAAAPKKVVSKGKTIEAPAAPKQAEKADDKASKTKPTNVEKNTAAAKPVKTVKSARKVRATEL